MLHIIVAGILGIPALLVNAISSILVGFLCIPSVLLLLYKKRGGVGSVSKKTNIPVDHVIITGGSSGIGLSIAKECVKRGNIPKVTILARNQSKLDSAKEELLKLQKEVVMKNESSTLSNTTIQAISVNVSDAECIEKVANELCSTTKESSSVGEKLVLFNCAGICHTTYMRDIPTSKYYDLVLTNQLGAIYTTRAFLPYMTSTTSSATSGNSAGSSGVVVLTSSIAGQVGIFGYTCYSPTKYALRGFAETLHMEYSADPNIHIQVAFPPDTNTPGYQEELKLMPDETKALNDTAGIANPDDLAKIMIQEAFAKNPKFFVYFTFEGWMLTALTSGMSPVSNLFDAITQVALMGLFRFISLFYLNDFWRIISTFHQNGKKKKGTKAKGE